MFRSAFLLAMVLAGAVRAERLGSHEIQTDAQGQIVPWFSPDPGTSYDHVIGLVWTFWKSMPRCPNGVPYYLQHMVRTAPDCYPNGIGTDQVAEALSSWQLLYQYSGDAAVLENMVLIADYDRWAGYGVTAIGEQTSFMNPGNSHTARHAALELLYCAITGDTATKAVAIRNLNWATYMVAPSGENRYPDADNVLWITDGYGDYVRHYLRAMAAAPELAPAAQNHLLAATSVIRQIDDAPGSITYVTRDPAGRETLRLAFAPTAVTADSAPLVRLGQVAELEQQQGYTYEAPGDAPGVVRLRHDRATRVVIAK